MLRLRVYALRVWWLMAVSALASAGSKRCTMEGRSLEIRWDEAGLVKVYYEDSMVVSANVGPRKGPTTASCLPTGVKFLTDTQEVQGRFTLDTVKMDLSSVLATLDPPKAPPPPPKVKPRPRPRPAPVPAPEPTPEEREAHDCVQTKAWDAYADGWSVRSISNDAIATDAGRHLAVQLIRGQEYRFMVCGSTGVDALEVQLVDGDGFAKASDRGGRQIELTHRAHHSGTYYLLIDNLSALAGPVGVAILHR